MESKKLVALGVVGVWVGGWGGVGAIHSQHDAIVICFNSFLPEEEPAKREARRTAWKEEGSSMRVGGREGGRRSRTPRLRRISCEVSAGTQGPARRCTRAREFQGLPQAAILEHILIGWGMFFVQHWRVLVSVFVIFRGIFFVLL